MPSPPPRLPGGVYAACLTPLRDDLNLDAPALAAHAAWLLDHGCDGLVVLGTTGEATSFSVDERKEVLEVLLAAGVPAHRLMVGTGCCAPTDTVALTRHAVACGVGGVLMLPPFYYKAVTDDGLFGAIDYVIQRVGGGGLRLYLYHIPPISRIGYSHALIERLAMHHPAVVTGIKDSSGDGAHIESLCRAFPGLQVFAGSEQFLRDVLGWGGAGCISSTVNVTAPLAAAVYAARGTAAADALQARLSQCRAAITAHPAIPALKALMAHRSGRPSWHHVRPPLQPFYDGEALLHRLQALDLDLALAPLPEPPAST